MTKLLLTMACCLVASALVAPPIEQVAWVRAREIESRLTLETCTRRYECSSNNAASLTGVLLDLTAVVHLADAEYYTNIPVSTVTTLYESILAEDMVDVASGRLKVAIGATAEARRTAAQAQLTPQADALGSRAYDEGWIIADLSREQLQKEAPTSQIAEAGLSMGRFSALSLACFLGPCPELSLAIVDWSAPRSRGRRREPTVSWASILGVLRGALLSNNALSAPLRDCSLSPPNVLARLSLLRSLVGRETFEGNDEQLKRRNDAVIDALRVAADRGATEVRVVYGAAHMRDLEAQLRRLGFQRVDDDTRWAPAFHIPLSKQPEKLTDALLLGALALYLGLDGADYVLTLLEAVRELEFFDMTTQLLLVLGGYFTRHAALYYALVKFVLD